MHTSFMMYVTRLTFIIQCWSTVRTANKSYGPIKMFVASDKVHTCLNPNRHLGSLRFEWVYFPWIVVYIAIIYFLLFQGSKLLLKYGLFNSDKCFFETDLAAEKEVSILHYLTNIWNKKFYRFIKASIHFDMFLLCERQCSG